MKLESQRVKSIKSRKEHFEYLIKTLDNQLEIMKKTCIELEDKMKKS